MPNENLLLSIQPEYATKIFNGTKKVELRRNRPRLKENAWVFVYVSTPVKALVGAFQVDHIVEAAPHHLWRMVRNEAGLTRKQFAEYYEGATRGYGIFLKEAKELSEPITLEDLREAWSGFHPPQIFRYLTATELEMVKLRLHINGLSRTE